MIGVIYPGHGSPSVNDIIGGISAISKQFANHNWDLVDNGKYFLTRFPSERRLTHVASRTSNPCRQHEVGFMVYRWTDQEENLFQIFPVTACVSIRGSPLHHWNRADLAKLVTKFSHLLDVDENTVKKTNVEADKVRIGCDSEHLIPKEFHAVIDSQLCRIRIDIHCKMVTPRDPILKTSLTS